MNRPSADLEKMTINDKLKICFPKDCSNLNIFGKTMFIICTHADF